MACKFDVQQAIYDKAFSELAQGRKTFIRTSANTIEVSNKQDSKARTTNQAKAIAKSLAARIEQSFNGHVKGEVSQKNPYEPVTIKLSINPAYVDHVYNKLPVEQQTDGTLTNEEGTNIARDIGYQQQLFSPQTTEEENSEAKGVYVKFLQFKRTQLAKMQARLNKYKAINTKELPTEKITEINNLKRRLRNEIEGNNELGIKGIEHEISELKSLEKANIDSVGYYVEKDLQRLDQLVASHDIDQINEALYIIDFYKLAGTFTRGIENPFFHQDEIFLKDGDNLTSDYQLPKVVRDTFMDWANRATDRLNEVLKRKEELVEDAVNTDPAVKSLYKNKAFNIKEITSSETGLKDTDWISMWTMDIGQGIWSHNGLLAQTMFSLATNTIHARKAQNMEILDKIDNLTPKLIQELSTLDGGKYTLRGNGIGIKGVSYQIFKEITKEGNETRGYVRRFTPEFFNTQQSQVNKFQNEFRDARVIRDDETRKKAFRKLFKKILDWRRENTVIMDINKLPEFGKSKDDTYKNQLIAMLGQKGYDEQLERQKKLLKNYEADRQSTIDTAIEREGKETFDELSTEAKLGVENWENNNSPYRAIDIFNTYRDSKPNNYMKFNNFIPRKVKAKINEDVINNKVSFEDTTQDTGFYSDTFKKIEDNPVLSEFYDVIQKVSAQIREAMPYELQTETPENTILGLEKTSAEILADKKLRAIVPLFPALKHFWEKIRLSFGVTKQSEVSYATVDPVTGKANYKVNDQFLYANNRAINNLRVIEKNKFMQARNSGRKTEEKMTRIGKQTAITLDSMKDSELILLSKYLHVNISLNDIQAKRLDAIRNITGDTVNIGKFIDDYATHTIVQTQSFDLPKVLKYYSTLAATYGARKDVLPILSIMKEFYDNIQKPATNNIGNRITHMPDNRQMLAGLRTNAIAQMDDFFNRVMVDNYGVDHIVPHGEQASVKRIAKIQAKLEEIDDKLQNTSDQAEIKSLIDQKDKLLAEKANPTAYGKTIYSGEDKEKLLEIDKLLETETNKDERDKLLAIREGLGKTRTATALMDNILAGIRTLKLGFNLSAGVTNFLEGVMSNMILASSSEYFDSKEIYYAYGVVKQSFIKNASFGKFESPAARLTRILMDRFDVLIDSKNELQKASIKTYSDRLSWLNPYAMNSRVEYINQSPLMIAMLRTEKIKGINGEESSVWDAYDDKTGDLKAEFRTKENVENWETLTGESYVLFKQKLHKIIGIGHGLGYDELRGMMIKSNSAGKALMIFKTWLPSYLYARFGVEQDDIQTAKTFKGMYRSYSGATGAIHGAVVGAATLGPVGAIIGATVMGFAAKYINKQDTGSIGILKQLHVTGFALAKKMFGMPLNLISGVLFSKQVVKDNSKEFDKWVGEGNFTKLDAENMKKNMADISIQLGLILLGLLVKKMLWSDDDDPNSGERKAHNLLINRIVQLSNGAGMYVNWLDLGKTMVLDNGVYKYFKDLGQFITALEHYVEGNDLMASGINKGESGVIVKGKKAFLPGIFKDMPWLGFESQSKRVFEETPFHTFFRSDKVTYGKKVEGKRAAMRADLEDKMDLNTFEGETGKDKEKARDKEINKILKQQLPTFSQLKKMGMTFEEFQQSKEESTQ